MRQELIEGSTESIVCKGSRRPPPGSLPDESPEVLQAFLERILTAEGGTAATTPSPSRASYPSTYERESIVATTSFARVPGGRAAAIALAGAAELAGLERPSASAMRQESLMDALLGRITELDMSDDDEYEYDEDDSEYGANFIYMDSMLERELYGPQRAMPAAAAPKPPGQGQAKRKRRGKKGKGKKKA